MVYCCSDIHGRLDRYRKAVAKLGRDDKLYVLGDVIDRGEYGVDILYDIMSRDNVELILGNHENFLLSALLIFLNGNEDDIYSNDLINTWTHPQNGGLVTVKKLVDLPNKEIIKLVDFLIETPIFRRIVVDGKKFYLGHGCSIKEFFDRDAFYVRDIGTEQDEDYVNRVLWDSPFEQGYKNIRGNYKDDEIYILGHRPVQNFNTTVCIRTENIYDIDGGCAISGVDSETNLILIRLNDMNIEYIN